MLLEALSPSKYVSYNVKAAQTFGLAGAAYLSALMILFDEAGAKGRVVDGGFFRVDRKRVSELTALTPEEQLSADAALSRVGVVKKEQGKADVLKVDVQLFASIICGGDAKLTEDVAAKARLRSKSGERDAKQKSVIEGLKASIKCDDPELSAALSDWIDGIYAKPNGYLTSVAVIAFQKALFAYTGGDLDKAIKITQIAAVQGYKLCDWAIDVYEEGAAKKQRQPRLALSKEPPKPRAGEGDVGDDVF